MSHGGLREHGFECVKCGDADDVFRYDCPQCGGPVVVDATPLVPTDIGHPHAGARGIWRFPELLPRSESCVTLGEGDTPLVPLSFAQSGSRPVFAKMESLNPTLSFKDRAMAVGVSAAVDLGFHGLVVASTGNAAVSASAYAAAAGLACRVIVGEESKAGKKLDACRALGADVEEVQGDYSSAYARATKMEGRGWMNVSTTYRNPLLAEGYRSIGFELLEQLGQTPYAVVVPIGAGPLLRGIERGFADAVRVGLAQWQPALIGVQAARVAPIYSAWLARDSSPPYRVSRLENEPTIATAIADRLKGYEMHGDITIAAIERSGGEVVAVEEEEIIENTKRLAASGIWVEPSAATALAALEHWGNERPRKQGSDVAGVTRLAWCQDVGGLPDSDAPVVLMLTGHGAKAPSLSE
ncbi:pyridoxal-phosphate dependent enzyme [Microcella sp.]|uniref:threonine synthase n=1 Tax=Microcella sp. TaxID=1913979 RepID=UPI0039189282